MMITGTMASGSKGKVANMCGVVANAGGTESSV
jgi:hypothetical protein